MTQQIIDVGTIANDGTGDEFRTAFIKCNDNFTELYAAVAAITPYTDEQVRDVMAAALTAGSNVTITPNDGSDTITIDSAGGGGAYTDEQVRDVIAAALVAGAHITVTPNDGSDTITIIGSSSSINAQTGTAYTLVLGDADNVVELTNAAAITLTIPPNSSVAFPIGTAVELHQGGAGTVTVAPGSGVTLISRGSLDDLAGQHAVGAIRKVATDTWRLTGDLA